MWSCKVATEVSVHEPRSLSFFSCTLQTRWKFVVNSCDVLTVTAEIGSHDIAFRRLEMDLATRVLNHRLHLCKVLLSEYRMLMRHDCRRRKLNQGQRKGVLLSSTAMLLRELARFRLRTSPPPNAACVREHTCIRLRFRGAFYAHDIKQGAEYIVVAGRVLLGRSQLVIVECLMQCCCSEPQCK